MGANSLATGMSAASVDAALEIARLPDLSPELLALVEETLLFIGKRDGAVSMRAVQAGVGDRLTSERLETVFFALTQAGVLTRWKRDQRGYAFDQYHVDPNRLRQIIRDVTVVRHVLALVEEQQAGRIELIATLPDNLPLDPEIRRTIPSLAAALHRLITEAEKELIILNPFFESTGFEHLETALLEAARRGVTIVIVSSMLSEPASINYRVIKNFIRQALAEALIERFKFYEYRSTEGDKDPSLHAKVIISDRRIAYIGSANLTEYGLTHNLEIGILSEGSHLQQLQSVVQAIVQSSAELLDKFFGQSTCQGLNGMNEKNRDSVRRLTSRCSRPASPAAELRRLAHLGQSQ